MKKLILILSCLAFTTFIYAAVDNRDGAVDITTTSDVDGVASSRSQIDGQIIASGSPADPCDCATASYLSCYTGDYSGEVREICYDSGNSNKTGADLGTPTVSADYVIVDAANEGLEFVNSSSDIINGALGTVWFTVYVDVVTMTANLTVFEANDGSNDDYIKIEVDGAGGDIGEVLVTYRQADAAAYCSSDEVGGGVVPEQTATRVGMAWDYSNDKIKVYAATIGYECTTAGMNGSAAFTSMVLGEEFSGAVPHTFRIYDVTVFSTYDVADPDPL